MRFLRFIAVFGMTRKNANQSLTGNAISFGTRFCKDVLQKASPVCKRFGGYQKVVNRLYRAEPLGKHVGKVLRKQ